MGCYFIELARLAGADKIFVSEPQPLRREFAKKMGADVVIDPRKEDLIKKIKEYNEQGVDLAIDACGIPQVVNQAMDAVRPGGRISTFGEQNVHAFADQVSFTKVTQKELQIIGSYVTTRSFDQTIRILNRPDTNFKKLITHRISIEEVPQGIELMKKGEGVEIIVYPDKKSK